MKWFLAAVAGCLLFKFSSSRIIPSIVRSELEEDDAKFKTNNDTLIFSHIIYRHGDRTLKDGMQLTNEGKRQMYEAGRFFRRRYNDILGDKYNPDKVYIHSSDYDRAITSAQANLAGLFYPTEEEKWSEEILWQPIPVHTVPEDQDILIHGGRPCPKYNVLYDYYMGRSPEAIEIMQKYSDLVAHWSEMSGMSLKTIEDVTNLFKKILSEKLQNNPLETWAEQALEPNGSMQIFMRATYKLRGTPELVRLRSGFLIREILERSSQKIDSKLQPDRVLWFYSAHSATLATLLNGLGFNELDIPPYASSLHFELYKDAENKHYIQFVYRKPDVEYPEPSNIPGCGVKCTLDQFYTVYEKLIPGDFDTECKLDEE